MHPPYLLVDDNPVEFENFPAVTAQIQIYWGVFNMPCPGE